MAVASLPIEPASVLVAGLVVGLALVHLLPGEVSHSFGLSREHLLSAAGGVSVAYAFLHLFPELDARREALEGAVPLGDAFGAATVYAVVLVGLGLFYGLERLAAVSRDRDPDPDLGPLADEPVFWIHVGGFVVYNAVIGYALVRGETGTENEVLFAVAMALHLFGNDEAMAEQHRETYRRYGRWLLAGAVLAGAAVGVGYAFDAATYAALLALLTGGIVFNAIKDELPRTRESRFWAFAVGAGGYAAVLLAF